ncbi:MAG: hypothetical protein QM820_33220 [Minicystis sp.]
MKAEGQAFSPWCQKWLSSLGRDSIHLPPDRRERLSAALAARGLPFTEAIAHVDRVLYGLSFSLVRFGIVEALEAQDALPVDDWPHSTGGTRLIPVSHPRVDPEIWCDESGAMYTVLYDLGVCEPTFDSAEHLLECEALHRVYLPERGDRYGFETQQYIGAAVADALGLPPLQEADGERCHAWANDRAVVVEAKIEQYLYGTSIGVRDGASVAEMLAKLPEQARKKLGIIKGATPEPEDLQGAPEAAYEIKDGRVQTYRRGDVVTVAYQSPASTAG